MNYNLMQRNDFQISELFVKRKFVFEFVQENGMCLDTNFIDIEKYLYISKNILKIGF